MLGQPHVSFAELKLNTVTHAIKSTPGSTPKMALVKADHSVLLAAACYALPKLYINFNPEVKPW